MSGEELATCAMATVMLIGRMAPNEVAIAFFESDTHVVKTFDQDSDLDQVADTLLDLQATGGTCADAALKWAVEQFVEHPSADHLTLFLMSDFCFFEGEGEIAQLAEDLAGMDTRFFGACHGMVDSKMVNVFTSAMPGGFGEVDDV